MKVKIKDYEYEIIEVEDKEDVDLYKNKELYNWGIHQTLPTRIKLAKEESEIQKRKTLTHELTHAFMFTYWDNFRIDNKFKEEDICCFMATFAEDILKIVNDYFKKSNK